MTIAALVLSLLALSCGGAPESNEEAGATENLCPITVPDGGFTPPAGYPPLPSTSDSGNDVWFGSDALWTVLPTDGQYEARKSVWWSVQFPGGAIEEQPPVSVTWTRLDGAGNPMTHSHDVGTNAYTPVDGWFMISGIDPDEPGCWQVDASYKGASLTYVYERT